MPCVGSSRISTAGCVDSHRASATFCWLPPESESAAAATDAVLMREPLDVAARVRGFGLAVDQAAARDRRAGSPASCWTRSASAAPRHAAGDLPGGRRCRARWRRPATRSGRAFRPAESFPSRPASIRRSSRRAASVPHRPVRRCRRFLRAAPPARRRGSRPRGSRRVAARAPRRQRGAARGRRRGHLASDHQLDQLCAVDALARQRGDRLSVPEDGDAIGERRRLSSSRCET